MPGTGPVCLVDWFVLFIWLASLNQTNEINQTNLSNQPILTGNCGLDTLQTIPVFYPDCVPSFLAV